MSSCCSSGVGIGEFEDRLGGRRRWRLQLLGGIKEGAQGLGGALADAVAEHGGEVVFAHALGEANVLEAGGDLFIVLLELAGGLDEGVELADAHARLGEQAGCGQECEGGDVGRMLIVLLSLRTGKRFQVMDGGGILKEGIAFSSLRARRVCYMLASMAAWARGADDAVAGGVGVEAVVGEFGLEHAAFVPHGGVVVEEAEVVLGSVGAGPGVDGFDLSRGAAFGHLEGRVDVHVVIADGEDAGDDEFDFAERAQLRRSSRCCR